jgi:hypothetical protein
MSSKNKPYGVRPASDAGWFQVFDVETGRVETTVFNRQAANQKCRFLNLRGKPFDIVASVNSMLGSMASAGKKVAHVE